MSHFTHDTVIGGKIGTSSRGNFDTNGNPVGPGNYEIKGSIDGPKWGFGSQSRGSVYGDKMTPGPGAYSVGDLKDKRGFSMSSRYPEKERLGSPGPGAYSPTKSKDAPNYSMGTGKRDSFSKSGMVPGPGSYDSKPWGANQGTYRFGSSTRRPLSAGTSAPGPGTYYNPKNQGGPSYSMRPKTAKERSTDGPGPGAYDQSPKKIVHDAVIGGKFGSSSRTSLDKAGNPVGPGMYDIRGNLGGPKWGFGSANRGGFDKNDSPGPGSYNMKATVPDVPYYERTN
jgi:hypothetical protein